MTVIRVGPDKEFKTIQGAYNNANNGDTLFIDEGVYEEGLYFVDKVVNLIGNTAYPHEGKVLVQPVNPIYCEAIPLQIRYIDPSPSITMYVEGITFSAEFNTERNLIRLLQYIANQTSSLDLVFNKCILDASSGLYTGGTGSVIASDQSTGYPVNSLSFNNCDILFADDDQFVNSNIGLIPIKSLSKCILSDHPPSGIFGPEAEDIDYILEDNNNDFQYGPMYSSYITAIEPTHCFSGTITVNGLPVERDLKIFRRDNGVYLGTTTSSGTTGEYYFETSFEGYHNIICMDDDLDPDYNDLIMSKCIPKSLPLSYTPAGPTEPHVVKSVVIDIADNWGSTDYISIRSVDFFLNSTLIPILQADHQPYATTSTSTYYNAHKIFDTSLSKTGSWMYTSWISLTPSVTNQRLICVFTEEQSIDTIKINNGHQYGQYYTTGARLTKIYFSTDAITDTTYDSPISNSIKVFDGSLPRHTGIDVADNYEIPLY